jgi:hypothetical protein
MSKLSDSQKKESATRTGESVSQLDTWCRRHDFDINETYGADLRQAKILKADLILFGNTSPSNHQGLTASESVYAALANSAFRLKILFSGIPGALHEAATMTLKKTYRSVFDGANSSTLRVSSASGSRAPQSLATRWQPPRYPSGQLGSGLWNISNPCGANSPTLGFQSSRPAWLTNHRSVRSPATVIGNTHSLVQSMAGFRPLPSAQTRTFGASRWDSAQFNNRPAWLATPR